MPSQFLTIINEIRISGFLEKMLKVIPGSHIEVDGVSIECRYLVYEDIKNFEIFSKQLENTISLNWVQTLERQQHKKSRIGLNFKFKQEQSIRKLTRNS